MNQTEFSLAIESLTDEEFQEIIEEFRPEFLSILKDKVQMVFQGVFNGNIERLRTIIQGLCPYFQLDFDQTLVDVSEPFFRQLEEEIENAA